MTYNNENLDKIGKIRYNNQNKNGGGIDLTWLVAIILFIGWLLGAFVFHVGGGLIHLLLVIIVIVIIIRLVTGRRVG